MMFSWKRSPLVGAVIGFAGATTIAYAVPNTFEAGSPISASDMNENFSELEQRLESLESRGPTLYEVHQLLRDANSTGVLAELGFGGLTPGRTYRVSVSIFIDVVSRGSDLRVDINHDGQTILQLQSVATSDESNGRDTLSGSMIFTASAERLEVDFAFQADGAFIRVPSYTILEELPTHEVTNVFAP